MENRLRFRMEAPLGSSTPPPGRVCTPAQPTPFSVSVSGILKVNSVHPRHPSPSLPSLLTCVSRIRGKKETPGLPHWLQFSWDGERPRDGESPIPLPTLPTAYPLLLPRQYLGSRVATHNASWGRFKNANDSQPPSPVHRGGQKICKHPSSQDCVSEQVGPPASPFIVSAVGRGQRKRIVMCGNTCI